MGWDLLRWTKFVIGLLFPGVLFVLGTLQGLRVAIEEGEWLLALMTGPMNIAVLGPFLIYYWGIRSEDLSLFVGGILVLLTLWSIHGAFTSNSSTAGLMIFWIPVIGYPLTVVAAILEGVAGTDRG